jgi:hypothetical protein
MKKQKKILDFKKIEIVDLSLLTRIIGGIGGDGDGDGDQSIKLSTRQCLPPDGN